MITETSKNPIPDISHAALLRAAALAESYTRVGQTFNDENVEIIRLRIVEAGLCFQATSSSLVIAAMIDALLDKEFFIRNLQAQLDALRTGGSDHE